MKKTCAFSRRYLIPFYLGEADSKVAEKMKEHLLACSQCQQDLIILKKMTRANQEIRQELEQETARVDWEELTWKIQQKAKASMPIMSPERPGLIKLLFQKGQVVAAGVAIGIILGLVISFLLFHPWLKPDKEGSLYQFSASFLEMVDEEMARQSVLDYLEKSRLILLSLRQSAEEPSSIFLGELPQERVRELLRQKKYFSSRLESFRLAKARAILEEIDALLLELALGQENAPKEETKRIAQLIEERRLLLKINLLQQELEEGRGRT